MPTDIILQIVIGVLTLFLLMLTLASTSEAANAASRSALAAEKAIQQNRAFLTPGSFKIQKFENGNRALSFCWENTGGSPAKNVISAQRLRIDDPGTHWIFDTNSDGTHLEAIGVGREVSADISPITLAEIRQVLSKEKECVLYAWVVYDDIYGVHHEESAHMNIKIVDDGTTLNFIRVPHGPMLGSFRDP